MHSPTPWIAAHPHSHLTRAKLGERREHWGRISPTILALWHHLLRLGRRWASSCPDIYGHLFPLSLEHGLLRNKCYVQIPPSAGWQVQDESFVPLCTSFAPFWVRLLALCYWLQKVNAA